MTFSDRESIKVLLKIVEVVCKKLAVVLWAPGLLVVTSNMKNMNKKSPDQFLEVPFSPVSVIGFLGGKKWLLSYCKRHKAL